MTHSRSGLQEGTNARNLTGPVYSTVRTYLWFVPAYLPVLLHLSEHVNCSWNLIVSDRVIRVLYVDTRKDVQHTHAAWENARHVLRHVLELELVPRAAQGGG